MLVRSLLPNAFRSDALRPASRSDASAMACRAPGTRMYSHLIASTACRRVERLLRDMRDGRDARPGRCDHSRARARPRTDPGNVVNKSSKSFSLSLSPSLLSTPSHSTRVDRDSTSSSHLLFQHSSTASVQHVSCFSLRRRLLARWSSLCAHRNVVSSSLPLKVQPGNTVRPSRLLDDGPARCRREQLPLQRSVRSLFID